MTGTPNVTPNEIRNAKFATSLRGFKREEVEEFLNHSADALEDALSVAADYQERYNHLLEKHEKLSSMERTLKSTLLEAKKSGTSLIESARADAKDIITAARDKQREIENRAKERVRHMQGRIEELTKMRADYQDNLAEVITEHLKTIKEMHVEAPEVGSVENEHSDITDDEIDEVVEYDTGEATDAEKQESGKVQPALESVSGSDVRDDDEVTKTWKTIQETDTDGPAVAATLTESNSSNDSPGNHQTEKTESDNKTNADSSATVSTASSNGNHGGEKKQETVVDQIARAVRSATVAPDSDVDTTDHAAPAMADDFLDEDTLYKKLAGEHESQRKTPADTNETKPTANTSAAPNTKKNSPELPGPGPDGIMVFGRKEDRERSVEENVKVLQELDSVIDRFTEELEDIQRK